MANIRVMPAEIGGGFGGKTLIYLEPVALVLSRKTGRPVKIVMTREEVFRATGPTSGGVIEVKLGANRDGTIVAADLVLKYQAGAFPGSPVQPAFMCAFAMYDLPNVHIIGYDVVSNRPKVAAYRAPGAPISSFGVESCLDELARELGMDPLALREKNAAREGTKAVHGPTWTNIGYLDTLAAAKAHPNYQIPLGPNQGRGIACGFWFNVSGESSAQVHVNEDGSVSVASGSPDIGGSRASMAMMAAETLGIPVERVKPIVADTASIGFTHVTGGSRVTFATGMATVVRALWQHAVQQGEIPGAYWASLTHPATTDPLLREIFAEVHMLSHLVGAANRADIRRLRQLEADNAALEAKVGRQQQQLRDAVVSRETTIQQLRHALEERIEQDRNSTAKRSVEADPRVLLDLIGDLRRRQATAESRCQSLGRQLDMCRSALLTERSTRAEIEKQDRELRQELDEIEANLVGFSKPGSADPKPLRLSKLTLLYVGGRQAQIGHLREFVERSGADFLHDDGGIEERAGVLQGLVTRADAVLLPIDCVSHAAMLVVKRLCRQTGKPLLLLRSTGLASFCTALNRCAVLVSSFVPEQDV